MDLLKKIENSLKILDDEKAKEIDVTLTYADLRNIRKNILIENLNSDLCAENLKEALKFRKKFNNE